MRKRWKQGRVALTPLVEGFWQVTRWEHGVKREAVVVAVLVLGLSIRKKEDVPASLGSGEELLLGGRIESGGV